MVLTFENNLLLLHQTGKKTDPFSGVFIRKVGNIGDIQPEGFKRHLKRSHCDYTSFSSVHTSLRSRSDESCQIRSKGVEQQRGSRACPDLSGEHIKQRTTCP